MSRTSSGNAVNIFAPVAWQTGFDLLHPVPRQAETLAGTQQVFVEAVISAAEQASWANHLCAKSRSSSSKRSSLCAERSHLQLI
jgi:hypothetical protein